MKDRASLPMAYIPMSVIRTPERRRFHSRLHAVLGKLIFAGLAVIILGWITITALVLVGVALIALSAIGSVIQDFTYPYVIDDESDKRWGRLLQALYNKIAEAENEGRFEEAALARQLLESVHRAHPTAGVEAL